MKEWKNKIISLVISGLFLFQVTYIYAQSTATIREFDTTFITYPFQDPNPIPRIGKIYPYFTFDGYSSTAAPKKWKMVELENEYIRVEITPEIGGKIWGAYDKTRNEPFIYSNDVVKFRNIAMRGPWTSGGIEFNFGIIGHTPTVSTPIDYRTTQNEDGSVSCYISAIDLLTRTRWIVEINLPGDKAWFSTEVYWINPSDLEQPYYTWMNLAVAAREDLHFVDPGTHYITHGGQDHPWPVDTVRKIDLSVYTNNAFEGSKSYHITGKHTDFFGTYYKNTDDGMIHLADRDAKPGKKVFLWALSDAGNIWETLLTDHAGQYVEVQSGRLFNQNSYTSSRTPFKQISFLPQQTDRWTEYWFPYHGIGTVDFADKQGVWHFDKEKNKLGLSIMSLAPVSDTIKIFTLDGLTVEQPVELMPLQPVHFAFYLNPDYISKITYGSTQIIPEWVRSQELSRPLSIPENFDQSGSYNQYLMGYDAARFRLYDEAKKHIGSSLSKDSFFIPALSEMAMLQYRRMNYDSAFFYASRALSINTYDPQANYYYGLAADALGQKYDALDGWEIAALSSSWRMAAWYQIAAAYFRDENWLECQNYLDKILQLQPSHPSGVKLQIVLDRIQGKPYNEKMMTRITKDDPDNHFVAYEKYLRTDTGSDKQAFQSAIRNELPEQTYLEMATWYAVKLNRPQDAIQLLNMAVRNNLIDYWIAYLTPKEEGKKDKLSVADDGNADFIFPFRRESLPMLVWASSESDDWKPKYYLALVMAHTGNTEMAGEILLDLPDDIDFAPLYAWRSGYQTDAFRKERDLRTALSINSTDWRNVLNLADFLMKMDRLKDAMTLLEPFYQTDKSNYQIGMALARLYLMAERPRQADDILSQINVLPYEGASEGRVLYQAVKLDLALDELEKGNNSEAERYIRESKLWPENLGVGKPFDTQINTEWEDLIWTWIQNSKEGKKISIEKIKDLKDKIMSRFFRFKEEAPF